MSDTHTGGGWWRLEHLGYSGLRLVCDDATLVLDAPEPVSDPLILTWTERERTDGARTSTGPLAATADVLSWLGRPGLPIVEGVEFDLGGFQVRARTFQPIPYATAPEAMRKTLSALRSPRQALRRVFFTLRRPAALPLVLTVERGGRRVAFLSQALHRFVDPTALAALVSWAGPVDLAVAGTDYDDEAATGQMLGAFDARTRVIADLTGAIRRLLGLPVRPLAVALEAAPAGTLTLN